MLTPDPLVVHKPFMVYSWCVHGVHPPIRIKLHPNLSKFHHISHPSRSRPSGSAARALVLLEKEGVHLIHGQSATGYDTLLHLGEVGLAVQTGLAIGRSAVSTLSTCYQEFNYVDFSTAWHSKRASSAHASIEKLRIREFLTEYHIHYSLTEGLFA